MKRICKHLVAGIVVHRSKPVGRPYTSNPESLSWVSVGQVINSLYMSRNTAKRYLFGAVEDGLIDAVPGHTKRVGWLFRPRPMTTYARDYLLGVDAQWYISRTRHIEKHRVNWSEFEYQVANASLVDSSLRSRDFTVGEIPYLTTHGDNGIVIIDTGQGAIPTGVPLPVTSGNRT